MEFKTAIERTKQQLLHNAKEVDTGHWQGVPTAGKPDLVTKEVLNVSFLAEMPSHVFGDGMLHQLRHQIQPSMPWADLEFAERVGRVPRNPHASLERWPWWRGQTEATMYDGMFSHTYSERYWPKYANNGEADGGPKWGIRYNYGDLDDLISLLLREPYTRQAWLPIFFPEDTGAVHGGRVPCTLGYQFMLRNGKLDMWYIIRSCDFVRHFHDDLYLSARLLLWVLKELQRESEQARVFLTEGTGFEDHSATLWSEVVPGNFHFHCFSMHYHRGDEHLLKEKDQP